MKNTQLLLAAPRTLNLTNIRDRVFASRYLQDGAFVSFRPVYTGRYYSGKAFGVSPFDGHSPKGSDVATYNNYYSFIQKFEKEQKQINNKPEENHCENCGVETPKKSRFCINCGSKAIK